MFRTRHHFQVEACGRVWEMRMFRTRHNLQVAACGSEEKCVQKLIEELHKGLNEG